jgi:hypothetical protein
MPDPTTFQPLLMFGFERSGTTLLSMMMGAHPDLAVPLSTTGLWYRYYAELGSYGPLAERDNVRRLAESLLNEERIKLWDVDLQADEVVAGFDPRGFSDVVARFHRLYALKKGKSYWASMDISTLKNMDTANVWFPDARFIHIVRDGRDVALSHETYLYGTRNTLDCAQSWASAVTTNLKMGAMIASDRYCVVKYEDLVNDSERVLRNICEFIGLTYDPQMLTYYDMVEAKIPKSKRSLWPELGSPPNDSKAYQWKAAMSEAKRVVFEREAGSLLRRLGYETYLNVPKTPASYFYEVWCLLNRGSRLSRRARTIGRSR